MCQFITQTFDKLDQLQRLWRWPIFSFILMCHSLAVKQLCSLELGSVSYREGNGNPPPFSCLENPIGQSSLAGTSPGGRSTDRTKRLPLTFIISVAPSHGYLCVFFLFYENCFEELLTFCIHCILCFQKQ